MSKQTISAAILALTSLIDPGYARGEDSAPRVTIYGIVKVNDAVRRLDDKELRLVAESYDYSILAFTTNSSSVAWDVNGADWRDATELAGKDAKLNGTPDFASMYGRSIDQDELIGIRIAWMKLPKGGEVDMVWGWTRGGNVRHQPVKFKPYKIAVEKIPIVHVKTNKELVDKLKQLGMIPDPKK